MKRLLLLLASISFFSAAPAAERNIILIVTDDESPTMGCYGDSAARTPAVDALAEDGMLFRRAYATTASCSASRSVILSGLQNHSNGQYGHQHAYHKFESFRNVISLALPRALAAADYRTGQIGKYHVAPEEVFHFENYFQANSRSPVAMADTVKEFITAAEDQPFFLYYATSDPHRSGQDDESVEGPYKPNLFGNPAEGEGYPGIEEVKYKPSEVPVPSFLPDTEVARAELAEYYQSVARIDQGVARLVEILKEADLYDKTLIVFTSDHGMAFAGAKTTIYEGGLLVPFVARDPYQSTRGLQTDAFVSHVDIAPSLLDFAGVFDAEKNRPKSWKDPSKHWDDKPYVAFENMGPVFDHYHGKSWIPVLANPDASRRDSLFASHTFHEIQMYYPMRAVWDREYKLIWNIAHPLPYPFASDLWRSSTWQAQLAKGDDAPYGLRTVGEYVHRPEFELYHVGENRYEDRNLADDPEYTKVLEQYKEKLKAYQRETEDPWIMKWDYE